MQEVRSKRLTSSMLSMKRLTTIARVAIQTMELLKPLHTIPYLTFTT